MYFYSKNTDRLHKITEKCQHWKTFQPPNEKLSCPFYRLENTVGLFIYSVKSTKSCCKNTINIFIIFYKKLKLIFLARMSRATCSRVPIRRRMLGRNVKMQQDEIVDKKPLENRKSLKARGKWPYPCCSPRPETRKGAFAPGASQSTFRAVWQRCACCSVAPRTTAVASCHSRLGPRAASVRVARVNRRRCFRCACQKGPRGRQGKKRYFHHKMADSAALGPKSSPTTYRIKQSVRMDKTATKNVTAASLNRLCAAEEAAFSVDNAVVKRQANASDTKPNPPTRKVLLCTTRRAGQDSNHLTSDEEEDEDEDDDEEEEECRLQPPGFDPNDDKKRRRSDRYDSSESSDR